MSCVESRALYHRFVVGLCGMTKSYVWSRQIKYSDHHYMNKISMVKAKVVGMFLRNVVVQLEKSW